ISLTPLAESIGFIQGGEILPVYNASLMVVLTLMGIVMLFRICQPLNAVRAILVVLSAIFCAMVLSVPVLGDIVFDG
ncbi:MAG: hypothetical protein IJV80_03525, partial [Clostridia bacterium]|nr:hypothetical protein [Clostridia bacterium]